MKWNLTRRKIINSFLIGVLTFNIIPPTAYAVDVQFFSGNDILFYDPSSCSVVNQTGNIAVTGSDNAEKIFSFLTSTKFSGLDGKSFNAIQAAGALGNFEQESGMDPSAVEPSPGTGVGLAQWSSANNNPRKSELFALAEQEGKEWQDLSVQLKMIENELNASYGKSLLNEGFGDVTDPAEASLIFQVIYEGAGIPMQEKRNTAAQAYYEKFKDLAPSSAGSNELNCATPGQGLTEFMGDDFVLYNQCAEPWGSVKNGGGYTSCQAACAPSSLAMVITNMTDQTVTPTDTNSYYDQEKLWASINGYGNGSWENGLVAGAQKWGLQIERFDGKSLSAYKEVFAKGGLVIVSGKGGAPFLPQGHALVIRGITDEGKFRIGDPGRIEHNTKDWDIQPILESVMVEEGSSVAFYN